MTQKYTMPDLTEQETQAFINSLSSKLHSIEQAEAGEELQFEYDITRLALVALTNRESLDVDYKSWYEEAMVASNEAGFAGMSAADVIRYMSTTPRTMLPAAPEGAVGWRVDPDFLQFIADQSADPDGNNPAMETVESVLLAFSCNANPQMDTLFNPTAYRVGKRIFLSKSAALMWKGIKGGDVISMVDGVVVG